MIDIKRILENQKEVKYLTYLVDQHEDGTIKLDLASAGVTKMFKFRTEKDCLNKLVDILFELKKLEAWMLKKMDGNK